jgi:hypothetical protein
LDHGAKSAAGVDQCVDQHVDQESVAESQRGVYQCVDHNV